MKLQFAAALSCTDCTETHTSTHRSHIGCVQYALVQLMSSVVQCVGEHAAVNHDKTGTKCAAVHYFTVQPHSHVVICCRLYHVGIVLCDAFGKQFDSIFCLRRRECNEFYSQVSPSSVPHLPRNHSSVPTAIFTCG